jgi:hypothetical protein
MLLTATGLVAARLTGASRLASVSLVMVVGAMMVILVVRRELLVVFAKGCIKLMCE